MKTINGKTYKYTDVLPNGDIVHWNGGENITEEQLYNLNEIMSRAWDALPEEDKNEINKRMELKYRKEEAS